MPHVTLHWLHLLQTVILQFTGQLDTSQSRCSCSAGHERPVSARAMVTLRVRDCVFPWPHVLVHALHSLQAVTWQSTAHGASSHETVSSSDGHTAPLLRACCVTERARCFLPGPQVCEHLLHDPHSVTEQSRGQGPSKQSSVRFGLPHGLPPYAGSRTTSRTNRR